MIYANNAGTSWPKPPEVRQAVDAVLDCDPRELDRVFDSARETVCAFLGITESERFLFTPGCTSALSVALGDLPWNEGDAILTSSLEHHAMARPIEQLRQARGVEHVAAPYRPGEGLDLGFVQETLGRGRARLVAVTAASNVTGELLPTAELARLAHGHDALLLVDAAQTVGVVPVDVGEIGADILTFAGHKGPLGPQGIGGLWAAPHVTFESPNATCDIRRPGTGKPCAPMPGYCDVGSVNMAAAAGLAAGIRWLSTRAPDEEARPRRMAADLTTELRRSRFCTVYGSQSSERTATVSLNVRGLAPDVAEARFRKQGILVRGGLHCAPMALEAISAPQGTVRISFGPFNQDCDVRRILEVLEDMVAS